MTLMIMEQREPSPAKGNRFRIIESYQCCDGTRTRVTHKSFATMELAQAFVNAMPGELPSDTDIV